MKFNNFDNFINENFSNDPKLEIFLSELAKKGTLQRNPFSPREFFFDDIGTIEITRFDKKDRNEINLQDILALDKSQGSGTKMMNAIIEVADDLKYKITLDAKPFGNDPKGLDTVKLVDFYKKFGFVVDMTSFSGEFKTEAELVKYCKKYNEAVEMYRDPS